MSPDSIAKIDGPGKVRRIAVGVIRQAGKEAADPADAHSHDQREDEQVSG